MVFRTWLNLMMAVGLGLTGCRAKAQDPPGNPVQTGVQHQTLRVDDVDFPLLTYVPEAAKTSAVPAVIVLHGAGGTGDRAFTRLELDKLSAEKGFIVLAPSGRNNRWHDFADNEQQADLDMIGQLLDMVPKLGGDPKRVYVIGFSNGGIMSMVVGARFADRFAAIGSGGSTIGRFTTGMEYKEIPKPVRSIPILLFHGMEDKVISYDMSTFSVSSPDCLTWWAREDGLNGVVKHDELAGGDILRDIYEGADGLQAELLSYKKLGHDWPNVVDADTGVKFNELLWQFLSKYSLK